MNLKAVWARVTAILGRADASTPKKDREGMPELGLRQLIRRNDVAKVRETLQGSADPTQAVNAIDNAGYTALFYAMQQRPVDLAMVQLLLDFGADPKFQKVNTFTSKKYGSGVHVESVVGEAMRQEVVEVVRLLVNAGADVRSLDASGYSSLIKAAHRRNPVAMIKYLISEGAPLDTVTQYGESAIRVAYHMGSFDAVAELLAAGADDARLKWTPLHRACAIGSESDVEWLLSQDPELEARDTWDRTPLLVAAQRGSISIFDLLLNAGADLGASAQGSSALSLAIESGVLAMVKRLLALGFSLEEQNSWGQTPLAKAVERDDLNMARALIELGANIDAKSSYKTIMSSTESKEMIELLLESGGDPSQLSEEGRRIILGFDASMEDEILKVKPDEYQRARSPREGIANPEEVIEPFWLAMIRSGVNAYRAREAQNDLEFPSGCGTQSLGPPANGAKQGPVWCAQRFGQTMTRMPNGLIILTGGEHEDSYDPDFCIYNDVIVVQPRGEIRLFLYPRSLFPPTDFHTATLVGDHLYLIGCLGYRSQRRAAQTQVLRLDTETYRMDRVDTTGTSPGVIHGHVATVVEGHKIRVAKGSIITFKGDREVSEDNSREYVLDLQTLEWTLVETTQ